MKIVRYEDNKQSHLAVVRHGRILSLPTNLDLLGVLALPRKERDFLEGQAGRFLNAPLGSKKLLPPIEPKAIRDFVTFERRISTMKKSQPGSGEVPSQWYDAPVYSYMNPYTVFGANDLIPTPPGTQALDFEMEVAAIVLRQASDVSLEEAPGFIAGYCIMNNWAARDIQSQEMALGIGPSKGKDFATTLGPWVTTPDELEEFRSDDRYDLEMSVKINDELYGSDSLKNMAWSFEELLVHASRASVVGRGDVLASGAASGGSLAEAWVVNGKQQPSALKPGDTVEITVAGLGSIKNTIGEVVSPNHQIPKARSVA
jgi:2-keto-4-pentenoate hydratase/2-oxohepta-3-ene-1,7-dioic acid hydratase in catechol pathway